MDWFDSGSDEAAIQIQALNHALKLGGRVMLRSAGLRPWYVTVFERWGFATHRVAARLPGTCIDRWVWYIPQMCSTFFSVTRDLMCELCFWITESICMLRHGSWRKQWSIFNHNRTEIELCQGRRKLQLFWKDRPEDSSKNYLSFIIRMHTAPSKTSFS